MKPVQMNDQSAELIRYGSIDFLIPDVKMLDEFYRRCAISMEDISDGRDISPDTDGSAHYFSTSKRAKTVMIQRQAHDKARSQHLLIDSLMGECPSVHSENAACFERIKCGMQGNFPACHGSLKIISPPSDASKPFYKKHDNENNEIEAFLDNRPLSFTTEFDEVYAGLEANIGLNMARRTGDSKQFEEPETRSRLADVTSRCLSLSNNRLSTSRWASCMGNEDLDIETDSVMVLNLEHTSNNEEVLTTEGGDVQALQPQEEKQNLSFRHTRSIRGFPGRFSMLQSEQSSRLGSEIIQYTFGLTYHPNGRIINKAFVRDPLHQITSLDESDIMHDTIISAAMRHAEITAAKLEPLKQMRLMEQRVLRREIHRECALARLEGVSVGYFRYFAGHMTVEEYVTARICVCWSDCYCNKLCTRFGDMLCPCSRSLELCD